MSLKNIIEEWKGVPLEELLVDLYIKKNMSMQEVADELHIAAGSVHKYLTEYGISKQDNLFEKNLR